MHIFYINATALQATIIENFFPVSFVSIEFYAIIVFKFKNIYSIFNASMPM